MRCETEELLALDHDGPTPIADTRNAGRLWPNSDNAKICPMNHRHVWTWIEKDISLQRASRSWARSRDQRLWLGHEMRDRASGSKLYVVFLSWIATNMYHDFLCEMCSI